MQGRAAVFVLCCALAVSVLGHSALAQVPQAPPPGPGPGMPPSPPYGPMSVEPNTDRPGGDFTSFSLPQANADLCRTACESNVQCAAFTYVNPGVQGPNAMCWLKSVVNPPVASACCTSGKR
jgi:hypothetical protein